MRSYEKALKGAQELARHITKTSAKSSLASEAKNDRARIAERDAKTDKLFKKMKNN